MIIASRIWTDIQPELSGRNVNVTIGWDLMPVVELIRQGGGLTHNHYELAIPTSKR